MRLKGPVFLAALLVWGCVGPAQIGRVRVQGRSIEYRMIGTGSPAVVFVSGLGNTMDTWKRVQPGVAGRTTALAFNRPGYGRSVMQRRPRTAANIVEEMREMLRGAALAPPYVLVGHSVGGLYVNYYARAHPEEVCAVVLVDASHPDQIERFRREHPVRSFLSQAMGILMGLLMAEAPGGPARGAGVSPVVNQESFQLGKTSEQVKSAGPFPAIPLVVVTATRHRPEVFPESLWQELQKDLVAMSPRGRQVLAQKSGHFVQNDEPELVVQAIGQVLSETR